MYDEDKHFKTGSTQLESTCVKIHLVYGPEAPLNRDSAPSAKCVEELQAVPVYYEFHRLLFESTRWPSD